MILLSGAIPGVSIATGIAVFVVLLIIMGILHMLGGSRPHS